MGITWIAEKGNSYWKIGVFESGNFISKVTFEEFRSEAIPKGSPEDIMLTGSGKWTEEESKNLDKTLEILEGKFKEKKKIFLPRSKGSRNIIIIQPKNFCPEIYPRKVGKPEKNPL